MGEVRSEQRRPRGRTWRGSGRRAAKSTAVSGYDDGDDGDEDKDDDEAHMEITLGEVRSEQRRPWGERGWVPEDVPLCQQR